MRYISLCPLDYIVNEKIILSAIARTVTSLFFLAVAIGFFLLVLASRR